MLKLLIVLAIAVNPFVVSYRIGDGVSNKYDNDEKTSKNFIDLSDQFTLYHRIGRGASAVVHIVKKKGGRDDGKLYALKAQKLCPDSQTNDESDMLAVAQDVSSSHWITGLNYGFCHGKWRFLVLDFVIGGSVFNRLKTKAEFGYIDRPDAVTADRIIIELVAAVEILHNLNIVHDDICMANILIGSDGHLLLTDFGMAKWRRDDKSTKRDWWCISFQCERLFPELMNENQKSLFQLLKNMTDAQIPELKNHPYFSDVDWNKVADKTCDPPFELVATQINFDDPFDFVVEFRDGLNDELDPLLAERFENYLYVAPQHQN